MILISRIHARVGDLGRKSRVRCNRDGSVSRGPTIQTPSHRMDCANAQCHGKWTVTGCPRTQTHLRPQPGPLFLGTPPPPRRPSLRQSAGPRCRISEPPLTDKVVESASVFVFFPSFSPCLFEIPFLIYSSPSTSITRYKQTSSTNIQAFSISFSLTRRNHGWVSHLFCQDQIGLMADYVCLGLRLQLLTDMLLRNACEIICAILLPPLGVAMAKGCGGELCINILLTILGMQHPRFVTLTFLRQFNTLSDASLGMCAPLLSQIPPRLHPRHHPCYIYHHPSKQDRVCCLGGSQSMSEGVCRRQMRPVAVIRALFPRLCIDISYVSL